MFISGGENIQPEEIERALSGQPEIEEALVVPVADPEFGERPVAYVRYRSAPVPDEVLRERLGQQLPKYKIPALFCPGRTTPIPAASRIACN